MTVSLQFTELNCNTIQLSHYRAPPCYPEVIKYLFVRLLNIDLHCLPACYIQLSIVAIQHFYIKTLSKQIIKNISKNDVNVKMATINSIQMNANKMIGIGVASSKMTQMELAIKRCLPTTKM